MNKEICIGNELKFQREFYNKKHNIKLTKKNTYSSKSKPVSEELRIYLESQFEYTKIDKKNNRENYGELGVSDEVILKIENGYSRKSKENYNIDDYYLRIYSLFKIYGFLDDYAILMLLHSYNIKPSFEKSRNEIMKIIENCRKQYEENTLKRLFNFENFIIGLNRTINWKNNSSILNYIIDNKQGLEHRINCKNVKKIIIEKLSKLSEEERKYKSLELGRETDFIEKMIKNNIKHITYEELIKILDYLELNDTDFYFIIQKKIDELSKNKNIKMELKLDILGLDNIL